MKHKAQIIAALLILASFVKSFKYSSNGYDIVFLLACTSIYLVYEFLADSQIRKDITKLTEETTKRFEATDKEVKEAKSYVSTMSLGSTYNKR